ncbi:hypothetical protein BZG36_01722 [Bifiguratus adelaidae]|uniref:Mediator of RNA polymerase II transcription subunit 21 n=1 Tax=Bifiguratus adelaidae TaxID=1938954 RepID=A0A261Y4Q2_9FUNG|nr:hypothetical protein BZG36_01722 [Bifiguratus adelaidae]
MDRVTQLQDAIDQLSRIFVNSIHYVHSKANMKELSPSLPVVAPNMQADPPEVFSQNLQELVSDIVRKTKEVDALIDVLPGIRHSEQEQAGVEITILGELERENARANEAYLAAADRARTLLEQLNSAIKTIADDQCVPAS